MGDVIECFLKMNVFRATTCVPSHCIVFILFFCILISLVSSFLQVDSQSLEGFTNIDAVQLLKNTGQVVRLRLVRYKHGPKYEQLSSIFTSE